MSTSGSSAAAASAGARVRRVPDDLRAHLIAGFATVILLAGGIGVWAATTELSGAVIGAGTVVVDSNVKKVQHPSGGIVGEIRVREGSRVREGDLLIRLDETITRANLGIVQSQLDEIDVRQGRLVAERDGVTGLRLPDPVASRVNQPEVARMVFAEAALMESRRKSREGQRSQLEERLNQLGEEIRGLEGQHAAKTKEGEFIRIELQEIEKLWQKNLAPLSKRIQLNREATRIDGGRGNLISGIAQARAKIAETRLQIIQLDSDLKTEVSKELREIQAKKSELIERRVAAEDQLRRVELRAPQTGVVHMLTAHTVGGVINAGEQVMLIVPFDEALVLDVRIGPQDISQVKLGQQAQVRLTAFNQRTTPEIKGVVSRVGADLTKEAQSSVLFYTVRVTLTEDELRKLGDQRLVPGMPAEVYIQTESRTAISYLLKPLSDQMARAFRER
jgi:HlyD family secretion protein